MPRTVLIVDDYPDFRKCARAILERQGLKVVGEAEDGASAVRAARELEPDVVLLDVQLPDADGFEIAARLLEFAPTADVVLTSSRDAADFGPLVGTSGARGFVPKAELSAARILELLS